MPPLHQSFKKEQSQVLVVDNDEVARFILGRWLKRWDVMATFCEDAASGLEAFEIHDYRLAIIDHYLPECNGIELIEEMRMRDKALPTFALHSTDLELHHAAHQHAIPYFLPKPFSNGSLYNILWETSCRPQQDGRQRHQRHRFGAEASGSPMHPNS